MSEEELKKYIGHTVSLRNDNICLYEVYVTKINCNHIHGVYRISHHPIGKETNGKIQGMGAFNLDTHEIIKKLN